MYQAFLERAWRRKGTLVAVAIMAACAWISVRLPQGLMDLQEKRRMIRQLTEENAAMKLENERRREHIHRLETNPNEQEIEIRKQLKLAHPNDTTFMLPNTPSPSPVKDGAAADSPSAPVAPSHP